MEEHISKKKYIVNPLNEFIKYVKKKIKEKSLKLRDVFYLADIPINYGYKLLSGEKRTKQRDIIIRICYVSNFNVSETNKALKFYEMTVLYNQFLRDSKIIFAFRKRMKGIESLNEYLEKNKLEPLKSCGES